MSGMPAESKTSQLQIRVTARQKAQLQHLAAGAGMDMSAYVLGCALVESAAELQRCLAACTEGEAMRFALADLNRLLSRWSRGELVAALAARPTPIRHAVAANHVAAMIEHVCGTRGVAVPAWVRDIEPLAQPLFGTSLQSLRLHLLSHSPPAFRRRNIFVDSSVGAQV